MKEPSEVSGLISHETGKLLRFLASLVDPRHVIVEIGAYQGRSTCYLASGATHTKIISIDPHGLEGSEHGRDGRFAGDDVREVYLKNIDGYDNVVPVRARSQDADLPTEPIGLLWIDGDHSLAAVSEDVRRFAPLVESGGHIVIDDYLTWHPGVNKVVGELMKDKNWVGWTFNTKPLAWAGRI